MSLFGRNHSNLRTAPLPLSDAAILSIVNAPPDEYGLREKENNHSTEGVKAKDNPRRPKSTCPFVADIRTLPCPEHTGVCDDYERTGTIAIAEVVGAIVILERFGRRGTGKSLGLHNGILLLGEPGTGKSTVMKLAANKFAVLSKKKAVLLQVETHKLAEGTRGALQQNILTLFEHVSEIASGGASVFMLLDELETILPNRGSVSTETNPMDTIFGVNAFIEKFDSLPRNVFLLATSNLCDLIDRAALSRFNFAFPVPLPNALARARLLKRAIELINPKSTAISAIALVESGGKLTPGIQQLIRATEGFSIRAISDLVIRSVWLHGGDESLTLGQLLQAANSPYQSLSLSRK